MMHLNGARGHPRRLACNLGEPSLLVDLVAAIWRAQPKATGRCCPSPNRRSGYVPTPPLAAVALPGRHSGSSVGSWRNRPNPGLRMVGSVLRSNVASSQGRCGDCGGDDGVGGDREGCSGGADVGRAAGDERLQEEPGEETLRGSPRFSEEVLEGPGPGDSDREGNWDGADEDAYGHAKDGVACDPEQKRAVVCERA